MKTHLPRFILPPSSFILSCSSCHVRARLTRSIGKHLGVRQITAADGLMAFIMMPAFAFVMLMLMHDQLSDEQRRQEREDVSLQKRDEQLQAHDRGRAQHHGNSDPDQRARAQGRASRINKRTSHITLVVQPRVENTTGNKKGRKA